MDSHNFSSSSSSTFISTYVKDNLWPHAITEEWISTKLRAAFCASSPPQTIVASANEDSFLIVSTSVLGTSKT